MSVGRKLAAQLCDASALDVCPATANKERLCMAAVTSSTPCLPATNSCYGSRRSLGDLSYFARSLLVSYNAYWGHQPGVDMLVRGELSRTWGDYFIYE